MSIDVVVTRPPISPRSQPPESRPATDEGGTPEAGGATARLDVLERGPPAVRHAVAPELRLRAGRPRSSTRLKQAGAVAVHLDVMDGHFVPNLSYGAPVIADWRKRTDFPFDTHLMISDPARYLDDFVAAGCDVIIFHIEVVPDPLPLLRRIQARGLPGVARAEPADAARRRSSRISTRSTPCW